MQSAISSLHSQVATVTSPETPHLPVSGGSTRSVGVGSLRDQLNSFESDRVPRHYSGQFPLHWEDVLGMAPAMATWRHRKEESVPAGALALLIDFCSYYADAPCWAGPAVDPGIVARIHDLRSGIKTIENVPQLETWLRDAHDLGLEPL
jgi:hypothetical protein